MIGAFVALDLFLFYIFWELMLVPMYVMIGVWGGTNRIKSAIKFFLYTMFGSMLMLAAILYLAYTYAQRQRRPAVASTTSSCSGSIIPRHVQIWLLAAFALAFFIKVPMWPVHTWLPDAHTEAPTAGSVILAAVMLKMGTYGYLRFCMGLFPEAAARVRGEPRRRRRARRHHLRRALRVEAGGREAPHRLLVGRAPRLRDARPLRADARVDQGAVLQMVNHGISTGALFLLFGVIYDRRHTRQIDEFGGLAKVDAGLRGALRHRDARERRACRRPTASSASSWSSPARSSSTKLGHFAGIQAVGAAIGVILGAVYMLERRAEDVLRAHHQAGEQAPPRHQRARARRASRRSS